MNPPDGVPTPKRLAEITGVSEPYASQLLRGRRPMPRAVAIRFWRETRHKLGPIAKATDAEIEVLAKFEPALSADQATATQ